MLNKKNVKIKTKDEIKRIAETGSINSSIFKKLMNFDFVGISTFEVDKFIDSLIHKSKARSAFKTVQNYNYASCISLNNEVMHGVPSKKRLIKKGDLVKIDIGTVFRGYFADSCKTIIVDSTNSENLKLVNVAHLALLHGIKQLQVGNRIGDIGFHIEKFVIESGFTIVRQFAGHGTGFALHEKPNIPHFGLAGSGLLIEEGMVLAVEPIVNQGIQKVEFLKDGWTSVTMDGKMSAQFEHTVAVTSSGPQILT